jgi:hypothetical protein
MAKRTSATETPKTGTAAGSEELDDAGEEEVEASRARERARQRAGLDD